MHIQMLLKSHIIAWELKGAPHLELEGGSFGKNTRNASSQNLLLEGYRVWGLLL